VVRGSKLKPYCPSKEGESGGCAGVPIFSKKLFKFAVKKNSLKFLLFFLKKVTKICVKNFTTYHTHNISFHFGQLEFPFGILFNFPLFAEWNSLGIDMGIEKVRLYNCV